MHERLKQQARNAWIQHAPIVLFTLSALLSLVGFALRSELNSVWHPIGMALGAALMLYIGRKVGRTYHDASIGGFLLIVLCAFVIISGYELLLQARTSGGPIMGFPNINILAANLALLSIGAAILSQNHSLKLLAALIGIIGIGLTGSRTALIAVSLVSYIILLRGHARDRDKLQLLISGSLIAAAVVISIGTWAISATGSSRSYTNLLYNSENFASPSWTLWNRPEIEIESLDTSVNLDGIMHSVTRIHGTVNSASTLFLYSSIGQSTKGVNYVASVWIKPLTKQPITLSSHLATATCSTFEEWHRCETPPGLGDGHRHVQLRLEAARPGGDIDVLVAAAQLEQSDHATTMEPRQTHPIVVHFAQRFDSTGILTDTSRGRAFEVAWRMFLLSPATGTGFGSFPVTADINGEAMNVLGIGHAHNIFLHLMAETGLLGLLAWCIPFFGIVIWFNIDARRRVLPLLALIVALNLTDFTYFHSGIYYPFWGILGVLGWGSNLVPKL